MEVDLHITDNQYLIALTIFFVPYSLIEPPSNVLLKRLPPRIYLSCMMLLWGIMMTVQGLVSNFGGLMGMRFLLGLCEGGLFPGVTYYLSCWYRRAEYGIRIAFFFCAATISGAFGGLIAAAISDMNGVGGKTAWAWIFLIQGFVTIIVGVMSFWIVQDFPATAKFLTEEERELVLERLQEMDSFSAPGEKINLNSIIDSVTDWKTWVGVIIYAGVEVPIYASALFTPSIINQLGYTATPANLLSVPVAFVSNNVEGSLKRGVTLGIVIGLGNLNGIVSSNIYRAQYQPWYTMSHGIVLLYVLLIFIGTAVMMFLLKRENDARDRGERNETIGAQSDGAKNPNGTFGTVQEAKLAKGDYWSGFRYTL
ncbi:MFS general substrate transporter [Dacryopinax primogenitus]|uniref:MFS general substrate transporter n=1 Tax=Dacryopinax primogenitus (strain DJM 731) TaxID=1858805 RepID=M5FXS7_DACPD|nr:MFS general substrate transporter [Dacryopinax primogenitus]EJU02841.1 MFS general substrate transporter [Dacryopinax primogenitus]